MHRKQNRIVMLEERRVQYVSKERRKIEDELLFFLRKYKFLSARFKNTKDFDDMIDDIVEELKKEDY